MLRAFTWNHFAPPQEKYVMSLEDMSVDPRHGLVTATAKSVRHAEDDPGLSFSHNGQAVVSECSQKVVFGTSRFFLLDKQSQRNERRPNFARRVLVKRCVCRAQSLLCLLSPEFDWLKIPFVSDQHSTAFYQYRLLGTTNRRNLSTKPDDLQDNHEVLSNRPPQK